MNCRDLVEFLEVNLTIFGVPLHDWVALKFLNLRIDHTKPLAFHEL